MWQKFVCRKCFCSYLDDLEIRDLSAQPVDRCEEKPVQNGSLEQEEEEKDEDGCERVGHKKQSSEEDPQKIDEEKPRQKKKYTRLSRLRRRRCAHKSGRGEDESDLSEGFESEEDEDDADAMERADSAGGTAVEEPVNPSAVKKETKREPLGEEGCWGSGSEEEEDGGTAFDVETDSDMNSQESRSDLEDIEDTESSENVEGQAQDNQEEEEEEQPKDGGGERDGETPPATNGPLMPSDSSISSNLQAMSSQLFQAKRCFRLAPTFSNMLLRPQASTSSGIPTPTDTSAPPSQETPPPPGDLQCDLSPGTANGTSDNGMYT